MPTASVASALRTHKQATQVGSNALRGTAQRCWASTYLAPPRVGRSAGNRRGCAALSRVQPGLGVIDIDKRAHSTKRGSPNAALLLPLLALAFLLPLRRAQPSQPRGIVIGAGQVGQQGNDDHHQTPRPAAPTHPAHSAQLGEHLRGQRLVNLEQLHLGVGLVQTQDRGA